MRKLNFNKQLYNNDKFEIKRPSDDIIHVFIKDNVIYDLEAAHKTREILDTLLGGEKVGFILELGDFAVITPEVNAYSLTKEGHRHTKAQALFVKNMSDKLIAKGYIKFNKPSFPIGFFTSIEDCIVWLNSIK